MEGKQILRPSEAARILGVSYATVRRMALAGELPFTTRGQQMRFRRADLDEYLEANSSNGGGDGGDR